MLGIDSILLEYDANFLVTIGYELLAVSNVIVTDESSVGW